MGSNQDNREQLAQCPRCGEPESWHVAGQRCRYNGWKNYETWCVHLWLTNEEATYRICREAAGLYKVQSVDTEIWTAKQAARYGMADWLKEHVAAALPELGATMASDLLNAALSEVDWQEIADAFLED